MILLPLAILAIAGLVVYRVVRHRAQAAGVGQTFALSGAPFWPTTVQGRLGLGALALSLLPMLLVTVIQIAFFSPAVLLAVLVLTGVARYVEDDGSLSVLMAFGVSTVATVIGLLFLGGEVFIGHD